MHVYLLLMGTEHCVSNSSFKKKILCDGLNFDLGDIYIVTSYPRRAPQGKISHLQYDNEYLGVCLHSNI